MEWKNDTTAINLHPCLEQWDLYSDTFSSFIFFNNKLNKTSTENCKRSKFQIVPTSLKIVKRIRTLASKFFSSLAYILESLSGTWKTLSMTNNKWRQCGPRPQLQVCKHIFTPNEITLKGIHIEYNRANINSKASHFWISHSR